jgi:DNA polymerase-3 subunit epsilon
MVSWQDAPWIGFDLETTGREQAQARIITAALIDERDRSLDRTWLVHPGIPIPPESTAVHGITDAQVQASGIDAAVGVDEIARALEACWERGAIVVAYNAQYDFTVLVHELRRNGLRPLRPGTILDPLVLWRALEKYRKGKKRLADAVERFDVPANVREHDAGADALAALHVMHAVAQLDGIAELQIETNADLMTVQAALHQAWAEDFAAWFAQRGGDTSGIDDSWPIGASADGLGGAGAAQ